ncbi:MAG: hypothetical protein UX88_C0011G0013 [Candidatus Woesebacteria bacterium GW2011_GWC2_47_16]|uniref:Uncharacterized protein n=4 Tax=Candidatus Woeseibacteriota TaxID=1752722 RepID=A0A0G1S5F9_9BACT|nr:MAG: hypothetical protein UX03_C0006G0017 [Candidatus Woesebacteria bacterium GW2011_GWE1_45_18]KKU64596.1 MAG: hypothetical protein UX88_C0011G0013 [Candidatus Woesebacteria bacterium GW2011_GWC2_47_16]OGM85562.1 MAG: hypothetical protein A2435_01295 [Candidatus Woesebacteria bacterium RIFOXYC1_FULL_46_16]OGM88937.1 MAG: hypothetical protein A2597_02355 [Candidatus Woesebacteria bacterium RIFOXYD1_FULL_46_19]
MVEETQNVKKNVDRSPAYPSIELKSAIDLSARLFDLFSEYGFSREVATEKLGVGKNSTNFRKIAALVQYGLLVREGNNYKITPLAKDIALSTDESTRLKLLDRSVRHPKIFSELILENAGKALPVSLDIRLRQLDYSKEGAKTLAGLFRHSLEFAGLLKNGIVVKSTEESVPDEGGAVANNLNPVEQVSTPQGGSKPKTLNPEINTDNYISYPLDSGIVVMFPGTMLKKLVTGAFLTKLNELEELGKGGKEDAGNNASNTPVEPD